MVEDVNKTLNLTKRCDIQKRWCIININYLNMFVINSRRLSDFKKHVDETWESGNVKYEQFYHSADILEGSL